MTTSRRQNPIPTAALLALLFALLVRGGIPAGYMLAAGDGLPRIVPCTGMAAMPPHRGQHDGGHGDQSPCAFALVAPPALPEAPPVLTPPPAPPPVFVSLPARAFAPRLPAALLPPATGPPSA